MKKIKILSLIIVFLLIISSTVVFADDTFEIELQKSATELQRGDEFNVKLIIHENTADKGIQGFEAKLNYDTGVFELQKNNANLDSFTENGTYDVTVNEEIIEIVDNSLNSIQNDVVITTIPFKVKSDANYGKSVISLSEIEGGHVELETGDAVSYPGTSNEIELNIVEQKQEEPAKLNEIRVTTNPKKMEYKVGEKFNPEGMIVEAFYSDNSSSVITNYTYSPKEELKETDKTVTVSYSEGNVTKTKTINIVVNKKENSDKEDKDNENKDNENKDNDTKKDEVENGTTDKEKENNKNEQNNTTKEDENVKQEVQKYDGKEEENLATVKLPQTGFAGAYIIIIAIIVISVMAIVIKKKQSKIKF